MIAQAQVTVFTNDDLLRRALAAWFRGDTGGVRDQPSQSLSECTSLMGKNYVVLRNGTGTLAVYRVRTDGVLRRMKRWPKSIG